MFDWIDKCEYPLPNPEVQNEDFQTKSVPETVEGKSDYRLAHFRIGEDGRLYEGDKALKVNDTRKGDFTFYTSLKGEWYEYEVIFKDSVIQDLYRLPNRTDDELVVKEKQSVIHGPYVIVKDPSFPKGMMIMGYKGDNPPSVHL